MCAHYKVKLSIIHLLLAFTFTSCDLQSSSQETSITSASPSNIYSVGLQGDHSNANSPNKVLFTVEREGKVLLENEGLYDDSAPFLQMYPTHLWVMENVLWFGGHDLTPSAKRDEVSVVNETNKVISYLSVDASDMFLLLEVQPRSLTRLLTRPQTDQTADISWVSCFGKFADGRDKGGGRNFSIRGKYVSPAHYCIVIREEEVVIQSREFEGFEIDSAGKTVPLPDAKNPSCQ